MRSVDVRTTHRIRDVLGALTRSAAEDRLEDDDAAAKRSANAVEDGSAP